MGLFDVGTSLGATSGFSAIQGITSPLSSTITAVSPTISEKVILIDDVTTNEIFFVFHPQSNITAPIKLPNNYVEFYDYTQVENLSSTWDNTRGLIVESQPTEPKYTTSNIWIKDSVRLVWAPEIGKVSTNVLYTISNKKIKRWYPAIFAATEGAIPSVTASGWWVEERQNFQILPYCQVSNGYDLVESSATVALHKTENGYSYPAIQSSFAIWRSGNRYIAYDPSTIPTIVNEWESIYGKLVGTSFGRWYRGDSINPKYSTVVDLLKDSRPVVPTPTYSLAASYSTITAGASVTVTLTTTNVSNDTTVPYTITGLTSSEISNSTLTGNFTVSSSTATLAIATTATIPASKILVVTITGRTELVSVTVNPATAPLASAIGGAATTSTALGNFKVGVGDALDSSAEASPGRLAALQAASSVADSNNYISKLRAAGAPTTVNPSVSGIPAQAPYYTADTITTVPALGGSVTSKDIAFDYSAHLTSIATSLAVIATNTSTIAVNTTLMAANSTTVAEKVTAMETYQKRLKELGEGKGIHVVGPWEWVGMIAIYRLLVEEGKVLDKTLDVTDEQMAEAMAKVNGYLAKLNQFPTNF